MEGSRAAHWQVQPSGALISPGPQPLYDFVQRLHKVLFRCMSPWCHDTFRPTEKEGAIAVWQLDEASSHFVAKAPPSVGRPLFAAGTFASLGHQAVREAGCASFKIQDQRGML